jgi:hypothetical protein
MLQVKRYMMDGSRLKKLIDNVSENNTLKKVIADGAYYSKENFQYLSDNDLISELETLPGIS